MTGDTQKIVGHRIEAGMYDFVIHGKNEYSMKILFESAFELVTGFAIDVTGLALR